MNLKWEKGNVKAKLNCKALQGGKDSDGSLIFVGRANHNGVLLPAKIIPSRNACYITYKGAELFVENFEVLLDGKNLVWEPASDGRVVIGAVSTGWDGNYEIYTGRAPFKGSLTIGKIHPSHPFLVFSYNGKEERTSNYEVLVRKQINRMWIATTFGSCMPRDAILGGHNTDGAQIYVGRATHEGNLLPCKVLPTKQRAAISYNGMGILKHNFDMLVGSDVEWKKERNGKVPIDAFPGGCTETGETLFIGRAQHNGNLIVGKVHPSHKCLYIPYKGKEIAIKEYEVLIGN